MSGQSISNRIAVCELDVSCCRMHEIKKWQAGPSQLRATESYVKQERQSKIAAGKPSRLVLVMAPPLTE